MKKHAFLIIAHTCENDLINLVKSIDFEYNDIFIHADKKWKDCDFNKVCKTAKFSKIKFIDKRNSVVWGDVSQIKTEMLLISNAVREDEYSYLHLLSGQDICIKGQIELHEFFESNEGKEFLCFCGNDWQADAQKRIKYYHLKCGRKGYKLFLDKIFIKLQQIFKVNRLKNTDYKYVGGSNWASITYKFAKYLLDNESLIYKNFSRSFCADEIYKHTLAYNSEFKGNVYLLNQAEKNDDADPNMQISNMRIIDWVRGKPYVFTEADFNEIISSPCMFVRKVSSNNKLPDMILNHLDEKF